MSAAPAVTVLEGPSLSSRTTLRLGGSAVAEVRVAESRFLDRAVPVLERLGGEVRVLGAGSNILARDGRLPLTLLRLQGDRDVSAVSEDKECCRVRVGAGMPLPALLSWAASRGLSGLEGLSGIPGSVGGAVRMNAGSYGTTVGDLLSRVEVFTPEQGQAAWPAAACSFGYRLFACPASGTWYAITAAEFTLFRDREADIRERMRLCLEKKKATQPVAARSAGCVFKNPSAQASQGRSAGRLLDEAGCRGLRLGGMAFSDLHANFLVNEGAGTADQAFELLELGRKKVYEKSGILLETEVCLWP